MSPLNLNGVGSESQNTSYATILQNNKPWINLDPHNQPPVMKTLVYSPDIKVLIAASDGNEYDVSADVVRGSLVRNECAVSTFSCELANHSGQYTKNGGIFGRMDRIVVYMKRVNWVQVFSGYLDVVPFAQMWAGNVPLRASCTLKRLLYTFWDPELNTSKGVFNQLAAGSDARDGGLGALLGNLMCYIGGWNPANVHIQDFPNTFFQAMLPEFNQMVQQSNSTFDQFQTLFEGSDHSPGALGSADQYNLSTGPGVGPTVKGAAAYQQQVLAAVDARGMGPNTADIQNAYTTEQLSVTGQAPSYAANQAQVSSAFSQNEKEASTIQTQARSADAAILAFACVLAESQWIMYANPTVPDSLNYSHDLPGPAPINALGGGTELGLFQQSNGNGSVQQRMNAYDSAGIFLDNLSKLQGWQNMDPATAISLVQKNNSPEIYLATLSEATTSVEGFRAGQGKYTPLNLPGGIGVSSLAGTTIGQAITGTSIGTSGVPGLSENSPTGSTPPVATPGRPQPDAQGAVLAAMSCVGVPYHWGGKNPTTGLDCSGLLYYAYNCIGVNIGEGTGDQRASARQIIPNMALAQPGDGIQIEGGAHTFMYLGGGMMIEASTEPNPVWIKPVYGNISGIYRWEDYGGPGFAPWNPAAGPGAPAGTGYQGGTGSGSDGSKEPIARNLFSYMFAGGAGNSIANFFSGQKSLIASQPLMQEVQAVAKAGLRSFSSAPNGDFIAYYPDWFGVDGKPVAMTIENIEMKDVRINLSDDPLTTHVYVNGSTNNPIGGVDNSLTGWLNSAGVATVENETLFQRLKNVIPGKGEILTGNAVLQKYGARPLVMEFSSVMDQRLEFLLACQIFMQKWAEQYNTTASFTFMPELFPGMRVQLAQTGIAVYVHQVTHTFDMEEGFTTTAQIMAPSSPDSGQRVDGYKIPADATTTPTPTTVPSG